MQNSVSLGLKIVLYNMVDHRNFLLLIFCIAGISLNGISLLSQNIHHNYFFDDPLSFREDHNWLSTHEMLNIYELTIQFPGEEKSMAEIVLDHNGLPVAEQISQSDFDWEKRELGSITEEFHHIYVMDNFFLRRKSTHIKHTGARPDSLETGEMLVNFFNREQYESSGGPKLIYEFKGETRPASIELISDENNGRRIELKYRDGWLSKAVEYSFGEEGLNKKIRSATYSYDDHNRPHKATLHSEGEEKTVEITYDRINKPSKITFFSNGEVVEKRLYQYEKREEIEIPGLD